MRKYPKFFVPLDCVRLPNIVYVRMDSKRYCKAVLRYDVGKLHTVVYYEPFFCLRAIFASGRKTVDLMHISDFKCVSEAELVLII